MALRTAFRLCAASIATIGCLVQAHGGAHQKPLQVPEDADWALRHMIGIASLLPMLATSKLTRDRGASY